MDTKFLDGKTLEQLKPIGLFQNSSNLIIPTDLEKMAVVEKLRENKTYKEIKRSIIRLSDNSKLSLSYDQIKEIELAWKNKIIELTKEI